MNEEHHSYPPQIQTLTNEMYTKLDGDHEGLYPSKYFEDIKEQNLLLIQQLNSITKERDEIQRRLDISLKSTEEIQKKFKDHLLQIEYEQLSQKTINKNKYESQIQTMEQKMQILNEEIQKLSCENCEKEQKASKLQLVIESIFSAAKIRFGAEIKSPEHLIEILLMPEQSVLKHEIGEQVEVIIQESSEVQCEISTPKQFSDAYVEEIKQLKLEAEMHIKSLENRLERETINNKCKLEEKEQKISQIQCEKEAIEEELSECKISILSVQHQNSIQANEIHQKDSKIEDLKQTIRQLSAHCRKLEQASSVSSGRVQELSEDREQLQNEVDEASNELALTIKKQKDTEKQLSLTESKLLQTQSELENAKRDLLESKRQLEKMSFIQEQWAGIMEKDADEWKEITQQRNLLLGLTQRLSDFCSKNVVVQGPETVKVVTQVCSADDSSLLPLAAWSCKSFPEELQDCVNGIARNETLSTPVKLRQVFHLIIDWYETQFIQLRESNDKLASKKQEIDLFLDSVFQSADFEVIKQTVSTLTEQNKSMKEVINKNEADSLNLMIELQSDCLSDVLEKIKQLREHIEVEKQKRLSLKEEKKNLLKTIKERDDTIEKLQLSIKKENDHIDELNNSLSEQQTQIYVLQKGIEEQENIKKQVESDHRIELSVYQQKQNELVATIQEVKQSKAMIENEKQELNQQIKKLTNTLDIYKEKINNLKAHVQKLMISKKQDARAANEKLAAEREIIEARMKQVVEQIKVEKKRIQEECASLQKQLDESEKRSESLSSQNHEYSTLLETERANSKAALARLERELQLSEAHLQTERLLYESQLANEKEEVVKLVTKAESEVMANVCVRFNRFFPLDTQLDRNSFEAFLKNLKTKVDLLLQMESHLRVLLHLSEEQSIEDEISKLILSK